MAGLFDDTEESSMLRMALSAGLLGGGWAGGAQAMSKFQLGQQERKDKERERMDRKGLLDAQLDNYKSEAELRRAKIEQEKAERAEAERRSAVIPSLFRQGGMTGGEAVPQSMGGVPMFSQPMGAAPMRETPGGFDVQAAIRAKLTPKEIQEYAALANIGRQEVARTLETTDAQGRPITVQLDKFGNRIGDGMGQWKAPTMQNLGNRTAAIDPVTLQERGSFAQGQSPESVASIAATMRGQNMTDARSREQNAIAAQGNQSQIINDPVRGPLIVNKATGLTRPAVGMDGKPILGEKDETARKNANDVISLIEKAEKIIPMATGSYAGAGVDQAARLFGNAPAGAQGISQLKAIEGALLFKMPRMEGPQSNYDVQNYRQAIGQIGDPTVPAAAKQAALQVVREIQERYTGPTQPKKQPGEIGSGSSKLVDDLVNKYTGGQ